MRALKSFEEYIDEGIVKKGTKDSERAKSLLLESERKSNSLRERLEKIGIKDENANDYVEYCYDIIMLIIRAKMISQGYHASGRGAHEAEVSFLRKIQCSEREIQFVDQMRFFRNGMLYYGTLLDTGYAEEVLKFMKLILQKLEKLQKITIT